MPTYDYLCENCRHEFERFQSITANPIRKCPKCNKNGVKRLLGSGSGIIFKGSGFYQTDYRSESYKKGAKSEKDAADTTVAKKETKTESKDTKSGGNTKTDVKGKKK